MLNDEKNMELREAIALLREHQAEPMKLAELRMKLAAEYAWVASQADVGD